MSGQVGGFGIPISFRLNQILLVDERLILIRSYGMTDVGGCFMVLLTDSKKMFLLLQSISCFTNGGAARFFEWFNVLPCC